MTQEVAGRAQLVERVDKAGRRAFAGSGDGSGNRDRVVAGLDCREQQRHRRLALALEHAVNRAPAMRDDGGRGEGRAVTADADEDAGEARFRRFGEIDDLGDIGQVVAGKRDDIRPPALDGSEICTVVFDLKVDQSDLVAVLPRGRGDQFEPERLKS